MDDLIIISEDEAYILETKTNLAKRFKMVDMGSLHFILRIFISKTSEGLCLYQQSYINKLLKRFNMNAARRASTSLDINVKLVKNDA